MDSLSEISARMAAKAQRVQKLRGVATHSAAAWQAMDAVTLLARAAAELADALGESVDSEVVTAMLKLESAQASAFVAAAKHLMGTSRAARA